MFLVQHASLRASLRDLPFVKLFDPGIVFLIIIVLTEHCQWKINMIHFGFINTDFIYIHISHILLTMCMSKQL